MWLANFAGVVLFIAFLTQCYISTRKYLDGSINKTFITEDTGVFHLPSITICPQRISDPLDLVDNFDSFDAFKENTIKVADFLFTTIISDTKDAG